LTQQAAFTREEDLPAAFALRKIASPRVAFGSTFSTEGADKETLSRIAVDRADLASKPDKSVIVAQLARWVMAVRSVWVDAGAQRGLVKEAYAMINARADAYGVLNDHMRAHDPFQRAKTETIAVEVLSVLALSDDSWRVEWREETRSRDGVRAGTRDYQATVTVSFNPPTDEATIRANPSGLYINSFSWAERLGGK
jgi:type IV secretion system protein VirB5